MSGGGAIVGVLTLCMYQLGSFLAQRLPVKVAYAVADSLAGFQFLIRSGPRHSLLANLSTASAGHLSRHERRKLARAIFRSFGRSIVDFLRLPALDAMMLQAEVSAEGLERLDEVLRRGRGAVLLTCHVGGWEVGAAYLAARGYRLSVIALEHPWIRVTEFFRRRREKRGIRVLGMREGRGRLGRLLDEGECVAFLGDWDALGRGARATFFGRPTRVPSAYVNLAARTRRHIVPGVCYRGPDGRYRVRFDEPIQPVEEHPERMLQRCLSTLERYICEHLDQWFAFNPIWPGEAPAREAEP